MARTVAIALLLLALPAVALGQAPATQPSTEAPLKVVKRPWEDPDAEDIDDDERTSRFWDRTLHPHRDQFERELKTAAALLASKRPDDWSKAEQIMAEAVKLEPDDVRGFFVLGHAHYVQREWAECAAAYKRIAQIDPKQVTVPLTPGVSYQAGVAPPGLLDVALGQCLSLSGDHRGAIARLKRAYVTGTDIATRSYDIPWRLGEAYMALGRLDDAIANLRRAGELHGLMGPNNYNWRGREMLILYALAAAYDRDEQLGAARALMERVVAAEGPTNATLNRTDLRVSPPEDVHYYRAMFHETPARAGERVVPPKHPEWSLVFYRKFLALHGNGPWAARARSHVAALAKEPISSRMPDLGGSATFEAAAAKAAILRADEGLQRCVKDTPLVAYEIRITADAASRGRRGEPVMVYGGPARQAPGVKASATQDLAGEPEKTAAAIDCLEDVAATFKLPPPVGASGSWGSVSFPVIWQGP
jgi:tetratricopeptide (TPR) repeat protein